jgi:DNA polymerase/3'-5' exonuclease PolX
MFSDSDDDSDCAPGNALGGAMALLHGGAGAREEAAPDTKRQRMVAGPAFDAAPAAPPPLAQRVLVTSPPRAAPAAVAPKPAAARAKAVLPKAAAATVVPRLLSEFTVFFEPETIPAIDRTCIMTQLPKLGGKIFKTLAEAEAKRPTHLVVCIDAAAKSDDSRVRLLARLTMLSDALPSAVMVKSSWLASSLRANCLLPFGDSDLVTLGMLAAKPAPAAPAALAAPQLPPRPPRSLNPNNWMCQPHRRKDSAQLGDQSYRDSTQMVSGIFREISEHYAVVAKPNVQGDYYRARVFKQAARQIQYLDFPLNDYEDAVRARDLFNWADDGSSSCFDLLVEILEEEKACLEEEAYTGRPMNRRSPQRLLDLLANSVIVGTRGLVGVHGIGPAKAQELFADHKISSVAELRARLAAEPVPGMANLKLNKAVLAGLRYYEDLQQRIPRAEVEAIVNIVREHAERVAPGVTVQAVGSYRRGSASSGDVDILVTHDDDDIGRNLKDILLESLASVGLISAELAGGFETKKDELIKQEIGNGAAWSVSFMGIVKLPEHLAPPGLPRPLLHRRMDIKVYAKRLEPYALLYFTGSERFNRSMRHWAKMNYKSLSDRGLVPCYDTRAGAPHAPYSESFDATTEADVFAALSLDYVAPADRNLGDRA